MSTLISSGIPFFVGQFCSNTLRPNGDAGITTSGNLFNSDGGSGVFYSYINEDPHDSLIDNTYIRSSGNFISSISELIIGDYNVFSNQVSVKKYNIDTGQSQNLFNYSQLFRSFRHDIIDNFIYYDARTNSKFYRYSIIDNSGIDLGNLNCNDIIIDYRRKKLWLNDNTFNHTLYRTNFDLTSPEAILSYDVDYLKEDISNSSIYALSNQGFDSGFNKYIYNLIHIDKNDTVTTTAVLTDFSSVNDFDIHNNKLYIMGIDNNVKRLNSYVSGILFQYVDSGNASRFKIDRFNDDLYYIAGSGKGTNGYRIDIERFNLNSRNRIVVYSGIVDSNGYSIAHFDFARDLHKTTVDFDLTDVHSSFVGNGELQLVSHAECIIKGDDNRQLSFINPKIITDNKQNNIFYNIHPVYGIWDINSGVLTNNIGAGNTTIARNYNSRNSWNGSKLRLDIWGVLPSGKYTDMRIKSAEVNISCSGHYEALVEVTGSLPLYINGRDVSTGTLPLHTLSGAIGGSLDLVLGGSLYASGLLNLFISANSSENSGIPLYMRGIATHSGLMPLFLKTNEIYPLNSGLPLSLWSTANSGIFDGIDLFLSTDELTGSKVTNMPIYMGGFGGIAKTTNMPMFLQCLTPAQTNNLNFFLGNYNTQTNSGLNLFMKGPEGNSGYIQYTSNMPMFIARDTEAVSHNMPFSVSGPLSSTSNIPFYMYGLGANNNITFYMSGIDNKNNSMKFYIHGF